MIIVEVFAELFFAAFIIGISSPYFQFNDILLPKIIDDYIGASQVTSLCLAVIVAHTINDGAQICEEYLASIVLYKFIVVSWTVNFVEVNAESFHQMSHIEIAIMYEMSFINFSKSVYLTLLIF